MIKKNWRAQTDKSPRDVLVVSLSAFDTVSYHTVLHGVLILLTWREEGCKEKLLASVLMGDGKNPMA